ncbi:18473_t:CDS:2 [Gigaspora margarita]|uniref:18473_t:CDS:1 n=1 Tax=Gigaspora margarita TaxID=4874 RepID=A0ABM8W680_GIGMA|nr:18473_t:CDS:2 [Gigaspora margarita]
MSSQNSPIILSKSSKKNQCKKELRAIKKAKIENPNNSIIGGDDSTFNSSANQIKERTNIFYDFLKWISEDFLASDLRPSNHRQSTVYTDPRFTFLEKFIEKKRQRLVVQELLDQGLLPLNSINPGTYTLNFSILSNHHLNIISDPIPIITKVPAKFIDLLESEVFNHTSLVNPSTKKPLWKDYLWSQVNHIYRCVEAQDKLLEGHNIQETFLRHPSDKLYIAEETTKIVAIDFFDIDKISAKESEVAVDNYCKHMIGNPTHQSKQFKSDLIEHFRCFTDSNNVLYTTTNTVSSHNKAHQKCVQVCPLGRFKGGELVFPELKLVVHAKEEQAIAFCSNLLVHRNLPITIGVHHSVVFYVHSTVIKQKWKFGSLFADYALDWDSNNEDVGSSQKYTSPKLGSKNSQTKLKNH